MDFGGLGDVDEMWAWSEPELLAIANAYERLTQHRRAPSFIPTLDL
jgi:hypothetical protein